MSFVNPQVLQRIMGGAQQFGQQLGSQPQSQQEQLWQMLAGAGAGMTQAAGQPGAGFAQAMGGGAQGMMQGQQQAQQSQMNQMQMQRMQQEMERQERISKIMGDILGGGGGDWASQVNAQLPQTPQLPGAAPGQAQATPLPERGVLSAQYESGGGGVGTVSSGRGDPGGASYGTHQIASNTGTMDSFLQSQEGQPFADALQGTPGSPEFNQAYQQLVSQAGPQLEAAQKQFLERTHVAPVMERAQRAGLPVDNPGVAEALYSQAIQHSGQGNTSIINEAMARLPENATPDQVIDALYDAREPYALRALERDGASPDVIQGVRNRYADERLKAKELQGVRQVAGPSGQPQPQQAPQQPMNGYQQAAQGQGGGLNIPPQAAQLLSVMDPDTAVKALWDMQKPADPGELPAKARELLWAFGGDEQAARQAWHDQQEAEGGPADQRDRKVLDYQRLYDVDENMATAMADGLVKPIYNEQLGRTVLMDYRDPLNPQVREVEIAPAQAAAPEEAPERTLFDIARGGNIAGALPAASETLGSVTGQMGMLTDRQRQAAEDRQTMLLSNRGLIRSLQDSPMYAQREREAIERDIGINPRAFDSEEQLIARMTAVHGVLTRRLAEAKRIEADPRMGDSIRRQAQSSVRDIEGYLLQMGEPGAAPGPGQQQQQDLPPAPAGVDETAWQYMTDEDRALWQN